MLDKNAYEVPKEMRDFAERSVDQARKAFDGFIGAAGKAIDSANGSAETARVGAHDVSRKAMTYAESNVAAAFDLAQKLVSSRDLNEVMQHQAAYLKSQMAAFQTQLKEIGSSVQDASNEAVSKVNEAASKAAAAARPSKG